jgi:acyl-CoA reductase-like NAD-dependent aldehyde dehydrogenase
MTFAIAADVAVRARGEVMRLDLSEPHSVYSGSFVHVPRGPVLAFAPFNFPLNLVAHKVAPALACGASVLLKPAPKTPLSALALAAIVREAGAPDDAMQVLPCDDSVAERLVRDDRFAVFTFTGSARVGYMLKAISGKKQVILELGGNAAAIVHEDAPELPRVLDGLTASAFGYAGQVCIKTQRIYVHHACYDEVVAGLVARARELVPEEPVAAKGFLGPVVDEANGARIGAWIDEATAKGARALHLGVRDRNRLGATVLETRGDTAGLRVVEEEVFGPVVVVRPYRTLEEAFALVNGSRYGLQAAIFTDSSRAIAEAYDELDVGGLVVNDTPSVRSDAMPYGGMKDSGLGREGVAFAVAEYTVPKMLVSRRVH